MKKTNQRTETDRLWVRIEELQWALAQILALRGCKGPCFHEIITAYVVSLELDPRLCIIIRLDLRAQDDVLVERKRYGFGYLSPLSIRKNLMDM